MEGFGYVAVGMLVVPFAIVTIVVVVAALSSRRGRTWQRRLLAGSALVGLVVFTVVTFDYIMNWGDEDAAAPIEPGTIEALFPILAELRVMSYWVDDDCRYIVYERGVFGADPSSLLCGVDGYPTPLMLDEQAERDIERIGAQLAKSDLRIEYMSVDWSDDGTVARDSFFNLGRCLTYVYDPGGSLPAAELYEDAVLSRAGPDWFLIDNCA